MKRVFSVSSPVIFGKNVFRTILPQSVYTYSRPVLVTDKNLSPLINEFSAMVPNVYVYDKVTCEPTVAMVEEIQSILQSSDCVIALGGGSPLDAAKAARACEQKSLNLKSVDAPLIPLFAVPTTAGTGSEVTPFSVVSTETKEKRLLKGDNLLPTISFIDPTLTYNKSPILTAVTGMDALCHALEAFTSKKRNETSDAFAVRSMMRIGEHLKTCVHDPTPESRSEMMRASFEAGIAFSKSSVTLVHGMSRPLGRFGIGHGMANAQLVSPIMAFSQNAEIERYGIANNLLFPNVNPSFSLSDNLNDLVHSDLLIPTLHQHLSMMDLLEEYKKMIPIMVSEAIDSGSPLNHPIVPSVREMEQIYESLVTL